MACPVQVHAVWSVPRARGVEIGGALRTPSPLSSLFYNAGCNSTHLRSVVSASSQQRSPRSFSLKAAVRAAVRKQKKKSSPAEKQWKFDELMLVWDDVFVKACENSNIATALYELGKNGHSEYGRGCVLMQETVSTRPRGAASGFTFKSRYSSSVSPELPSYTSVQRVAEYVPKEFITDPFKAPVSSSETPPASMEEGKVRVVEQGKLIQVLRGMDKTRLLGLLADPESDELEDEGARDVGGEEPVDPAKDELVIMLSVLVDGQQAVGADVLKAFPTLEDGATSNAASLWTLTLRDGLPD
ncbi:unnamed protein product [Calypogeia fissa]